jgi:hypothetical protein
LDKLINQEWKTRLSLKTGRTGTVTFRGFKGEYRVVYTDASGVRKTLHFHLSKDENVQPHPG